MPGHVKVRASADETTLRVNSCTFSSSSSRPPREPRIVIVHDYVTQRGGAERVVLDLLRSFPGTRLVTACFEASSTYPRFAAYDIETLWLDRVPMFRRDPRTAFPFLAKAFSRHIIDDADLVICSSSGWAHRVTTSAPKIVYCHNPARWLYQPDDYFADLPHWIRRGHERAPAFGRHRSPAMFAVPRQFRCCSATYSRHLRDRSNHPPALARDLADRTGDTRRWYRAGLLADHWPRAGLQAHRIHLPSGGLDEGRTTRRRRCAASRSLRTADHQAQE